MGLHDSPYLKQLLGKNARGDGIVRCPKCGGFRLHRTFQPARPEIRLWRWVILSPRLERLVLICPCGYSWDEPVGSVLVKPEPE